MTVYECIVAVSAEIGTAGIAKSRSNTEQKYKFRGIDDVYNALSPILSKHKLVILPRILSRTVSERTTAKGTVLFTVVVEAEFDFVSATDPDSKHVVRTYGEAMDTGDKATNKAMSAAYKYAAFQAFCIPTEGDNDADQTTHEIAAKAPEGYDGWLLDMEATADEGLEPLKAAWKGSKAEYRKHIPTDKWEAVKVKASAVDAKKVPVTA